MAFPVVANFLRQIFTGGTTSHNVTMPATVNAGDLLIMETSCANASFTTPTDWSAGPTTTNGTTIRLAGFYKIADGSEGGTTVDIVTSTSRRIVVHTYRITGWHGTTPPEWGTNATGSSTTPNPPSFAPSWGAADTLWLAVNGIAGTLTLTTSPTNYTDGAADASASTGPTTTASARREINGSPEDPGTFTMSATGAWVASTIAIRPALSGITLSHIGPTATLFAPQVNGQVQLALIATTTVLAPQVNGRVVLSLISSTQVFEPVRVAGVNVGLGLISSTQVFAPQVNGQVTLALISSTQVFAPQVNAAIGLGLISSTQVFAPAIGLNTITLGLISSTQVFAPVVTLTSLLLGHISSTQIFAPQVNGRVTLAHIGPTATMFAPRIFLSVTRVPASVVSNDGWDTGPTPGGDIDAALAVRGGDYITVTA